MRSLFKTGWYARADEAVKAANPEFVGHAILSASDLHATSITYDAAWIAVCDLAYEWEREDSDAR